MVFIKGSICTSILVPISSVLLKTVSQSSPVVCFASCLGIVRAWETAFVQVVLNWGMCSWCFPELGGYLSLRTQLESAKLGKFVLFGHLIHCTSPELCNVLQPVQHNNGAINQWGWMALQF